MARKSRKNIPPETEKCEFIIYNTAAYIRLSVDDNKKRGNSIETQKSILENYIAVNPELKLYDTYTDNGTTGTNFDRPSFKRMMNDVENKKVNCIIVKDLSRLGRNAIDTGYYVEKYFPTNGIRFISVNDNYDTDNTDNNSVILPLKNMINETYSIDIGKKIREQAHQDMKVGKFIGGRPPYGYLKAPDDCHKLIINEETAPIVKQIFEWAHDKVSLNDIVKRLNESNILQPSQYAQSKGIITHENLIGNGRWQTRTVKKILSSEVYVGDMVQGKTKSMNHKQFRVYDKRKWITVKNTHMPIISREMFDSVQAFRTQVGDKYKKLDLVPYSENIFKGKIFCGHCGTNLHRQRGHNIYFIYCLSNSRVAKNSCLGVNIKEQDLISMVLTVIHKQASVIIGKQLILQQKDSMLKSREKSIKSQVSVFRQNIDTNKRYLQSLYESLIKNIITCGEYTSMKSDYEEKITLTMKNISRLETEHKQFAKQVSEYADLADTFKDICKNKELTALLVNKMIDKITVYHDKRIDISFRFQSEYNMIDEVCVNE